MTKYIDNITVSQNTMGETSIGITSWQTYWDKPKLVISFDEVTESEYLVAFPLFVSKGAKMTIYTIGNQIDDPNKLSWDNLTEMHNAGMDIQCHSFGHANLTTLTESQVKAEMQDNNDIFETNGLPAPLHHAYPLGAYNQNIKTWIGDLRKTGRGVDSIYYPIFGDSDKMSTNAISIDNLSDSGLVTVKGYMDEAKAANGLIQLYGHGMSPAGGVYEVPTQKCADILDYAAANGFEILTISELYAMMKKNTSSQDMVDISISSIGDGSGVATFKLYAKEDTTLTLTGNAKFYSDAAGTLDESNTYWLQRGGDGSGSRTIYVRCSSGTSVLSLAKDMIVKIVGWIAAANAPSLGGDIGLLTELTYLSVAGNNTISGNVGLLTKLTYLYVSGSNTLSGSVSGLTLLTDILVSGSNTISGDIAGLTLLTSVTMAGSNTISGNVSGLTALTMLNVTGSNTISGDISALTNLVFLNVTGGNTLSGSVIGLTSMTFMLVSGSNTLTGDVAGLVLLQYASCSSTGIACSRVILLTDLSNINLTPLYTSANVNQILADFWTNRNEAKTRSDRNINLRGAIGSGAPTGQGIIDKAALQGYSTPTPPGTTPNWTVTTR